jgi:hypothetical protein
MANDNRIRRTRSQYRAWSSHGIGRHRQVSRDNARPAGMPSRGGSAGSNWIAGYAFWPPGVRGTHLKTRTAWRRSVTRSGAPALRVQGLGIQVDEPGVLGRRGPDVGALAGRRVRGRVPLLVAMMSRLSARTGPTGGAALRLDRVRDPRSLSWVGRSSRLGVQLLQPRSATSLSLRRRTLFARYPHWTALTRNCAMWLAPDQDGERGMALRHRR